MDPWVITRLVHLLAMAFFVGGQLVLVAAVLPAVRARPDDGLARDVARRFGVGSAVALTLLVVTGAAMASHFARWDDPLLHAKLALLVVVGVLTGVHIRLPAVRGVSLAVLVASLGVVWCGVALAH